MPDLNWENIEEIFHAALALSPPERAAYLERRCNGDKSFRRAIESLLKSHEETGHFVDTPAYQSGAEMLLDQAELKSGEMVAHYQILSLLGEGGMGKVYLAEDTKLNRRVSLKFVSRYFTSDDERRFEQEARAISALNHPNTLTIHEINETEGRRFIATEFVEGQTLRQRLSSAVKIDDALDIAIQVASALTAAHRVNIVHRDIKPENIMIRRDDGLVKLLDFGLAKTSIVQRPFDEEAPTRITTQTAPGVVIGTVAYMSPEQARGEEVDERTDIWSLGVVVYEMLAGCPPFVGASANEIISLILSKTDPPMVTNYSSEVPAGLERIIERSLTKAREKRYQKISEMLADLQSMKQELEFSAKLRSAQAGTDNEHPQTVTEVGPLAANTVGSFPFPTSAQRSLAGSGEIKQAVATISQSLSFQIKSHKLVSAALFSALCLALAGIVFAPYRFLTRARPAPRFQAITISRLTNQGNTIHATISPDGKYCAYILHEFPLGQIKESIWLRQISDANDRPIISPDGPGGGYGLTFSPDGNELYFVPHNSTMGWLYRAPAFGGTAVKLLDGIDSEISFSPDGKQVAFYRQNYPDRGDSGVFIANADGTAIRQIASRRQPEQFGKAVFTGPSWSSDGKLMACALTTKDVARLITIDVADGVEHELTTEPWDSIAKVEWLPDMSGLLMVAHRERSAIDQLWFVPHPVGEPRRITSDLNSYRDVSVSRDSTKILTVRTSNQSSIWSTVAGDSKRAAELATGDIGFLSWGADNGLSWLPNGHIIYVSQITGSPEIWIMDSHGNNRRQLTNGGYNVAPAISPDGRYIVFISGRAGVHNVWRMNVDGSEATQLTTSGAADLTPVITPDKLSVIYTAEVDGKLSLWKAPIAGGNADKLIDMHARVPAISPDGKLIAYLNSDKEPGIFGIPTKLMVASLATGKNVQTFDLQAGPAFYTFNALRWTTDGRALLYGVGANIWRQELAGGPPQQVTNFSDLAMLAFDLSPDGKQFICQRGRGVRDAVLITDAANFTLTSSRSVRPPVSYP